MHAASVFERCVLLRDSGTLSAGVAEQNTSRIQYVLSFQAWRSCGSGLIKIHPSAAHSCHGMVRATAIRCVPYCVVSQPPVPSNHVTLQPLTMQISNHVHLQPCPTPAMPTSTAPFNQPCLRPLPRQQHPHRAPAYVLPRLVFAVGRTHSRTATRLMQYLNAVGYAMRHLGTPVRRPLGGYQARPSSGALRVCLRRRQLGRRAVFFDATG